MMLLIVTLTFQYQIERKNINIIMEMAIINQDKIILLILKIFTKIVSIIEIIMKKFKNNNKYK